MFKQAHELEVCGVLVCAITGSEPEGFQGAGTRFAKGEAYEMEVDTIAMKASTSASEHLPFRRKSHQYSMANRPIDFTCGHPRV